MFATAPPASPQALAPVAAGERVEILDVLRGFALFGVLVANLMANAFWSLSRSSMAELPTAWWDSWMVPALRFLVSGKFMFLFALLFGLGLAVQMERAAARGAAFVPVYLRRLGVLLAIGAAHTVLLWFGDILAIYALGGFALFAVRSLPGRRLLAGGVLLAGLSYLALATMPWVEQQLGGTPKEEARAARAEWVSERVETLPTGGYGAVVEDNLRGAVRLNRGPRFGACLGYSLGIFLLGLVLGRRRLLQDSSSHPRFFRRLLLWGLVTGIPANLAHVSLRSAEMDSAWYLPVRVAAIAGIFGLGSAYLAALVLLFQRPAARRILGPLAPVGRMALTNYLLHSVCFVILFSGVGLGLAGRFGPSLAVPVGAGIFALQILGSRLWLARFRFGPAEWLWRRLTYGLPASEPVPAVEAAGGGQTTPRPSAAGTVLP